MNGLQVVPVEVRKQFDDFIRVAAIAEANNPRWVEQLHDEARQMLASKSSPFLRENSIQPFVAYRNGAPVGRIVATVDASHQLKYGDDCGFFGFLESVDEPEVFRALFEAAESFLKRRGMKKARGPFGLNVNGESGLLVEGFDQPHVLQTNHCPPYYSERVEALGYAKAVDLLALTCTLAECRLPERVARDTARFHAPEIEIRHGQYRHFFRDLAKLVSFYNDAWSENMYSLPVGAEEARFSAKLMMPVVNPNWIYFAYHNNELISLQVQMPDVNETLRGLKGRLLPLGLLKILWRVHVRGTRRARVMMAATAKRWRETPVGMTAMAQLMARSIRDARDAGVKEVEYSWLLEHNHSAVDPVLRLPAKRTRVFRIYEKSLLPV